MSDIEDILSKAKSGDRDAILAVLSRGGFDSEIIQHIAGWNRGRERDIAAFNNLVAARVHYVRRGSVGISKHDRIAELIDKFGLSSNIAKHIANKQGYPEVCAEAERQIKSGDETESNF